MLLFVFVFLYSMCGFSSFFNDKALSNYVNKRIEFFPPLKYYLILISFQPDVIYLFMFSSWLLCCYMIKNISKVSKVSKVEKKNGLERNWVSVTNSNFYTPISSQSDGVNLWHLKLRWFDLSNLYIVWNIKGLQHWFAKI